MSLSDREHPASGNTKCVSEVLFMKKKLVITLVAALCVM